MIAIGHLPARVSNPEFRFRPLTRAHLPLLHEWINRPHVAEWWDDQRDLESVLRTFGDSPMILMLFGLLGQDAIGQPLAAASRARMGRKDARVRSMWTPFGSQWPLPPFRLVGF